jgi:nucleoside-triphosphatase THEP1
MLKKATPTEILVIDEFGFMEFEKKKGWSHAFEIIPKGEYQIGLIVVRPIYVPLAKSLWNVNEIIRLNNLSSVNERVIRLIDNYHLDRR